MADVLIVCVREDESQAKALADMFERAGFTVGGAPTGDTPLRTSGAAVVVWSQASIRSRPFLDAAQRVVNAGKGVVACLIEPPPASSINNSPAFDLTRWSGDSDDAALDPLFFAVDRMVNSARAAVGAAPAQPSAAYEPAPTRPAPPQRPSAAAPPYVRAVPPPAASAPPGFQTRTRAPAPPAQPPQTHYGAAAPRHSEPARQDYSPDSYGQDPLGSEAEHWRAIRNSKDAGDFLDYLARYGANGAFSELADLRLKQLQQAPAPTQLRDVARASNVEPLRRPAPPPEPYRAPARDNHFYDEPPAERVRERPAERRSDAYRESPAYAPPPVTPKTGGGGVRAFFLLLLLFGGAIGGGMYLGLWQMPQPETAEVEDVRPVPPPGEPAGGAETPPALAAEAPPAMGGPSPGEEQSFDQSNAATRAAPIPDPADSFTPAPVRSWEPPGVQPSSGGPVPLLPPVQEASAPPLGPPASAPQPAPSQAIAAPANVIWAQRPNGDTLASLYPARARRGGVGGRVVLECAVQSSMAVSCAVNSETPAGAGFGRAALDAASRFRAQPVLSDGRPSVGARTRVALTFRPPAE